MVNYCISKDGLLIHIWNKDIDLDRFEKAGFHIKKNKILFPNKDRIAAEQIFEDAWQINPSAFLSAYPEEVDTFRSNEKLKDKMCKR